MYRLCIAGVSIAIIFLSVISARFAFADFFYEQATAEYQKLKTDQLVYSNELDTAFQQINVSLQWRRSAADALDFKADLLYQAWWLSPDAQYLNESSLLRDAVSLHEEAAKLRQNWSFSTARLALIHAQQANLTNVFDYWFAESHRLGLYETRIARASMLLGLENWSRLNQANRKRTLDFIAASVEQKANSTAMMVAVLDQYHQRENVCRVLPSTPRLSKVCAL